MELLVSALIAVVIAFLLGYYASKKAFQVITVSFLFVGSFLVYLWVDIQNTQAGDVMGSLGVVIGIWLILVAGFLLGVFCLGMCIGRAMREGHQKN